RARTGYLARVANHANLVRLLVYLGKLRLPLVGHREWSNLDFYRAEERLLILLLEQLRTRQTLDHSLRIDQILPNALNRRLHFESLFNLERHQSPPSRELCVLCGPLCSLRFMALFDAKNAEGRRERRESWTNVDVNATASYDRALPV